MESTGEIMAKQSRDWPPRRDSAGIVQTCGNPIDGGTHRVVQISRRISGLFAPQQFHLNKTHSINVGIAQPDGPRKHWIFFEQPFLLFYEEQHSSCALKFFNNHLPD